MSRRLLIGFYVAALVWTAVLVVAVSAGAARIDGTYNGDDLMGTPAYDAMFGYAGDDELFGLGSQDFLRGGEGDDTLRGNRGADILVGGAGDDWLLGGKGNDFLRDTRGLLALACGRGYDWAAVAPENVAAVEANYAENSCEEVATVIPDPPPAQ